jgi:hypothetical protein
MIKKINYRQTTFLDMIIKAIDHEKKICNRHFSAWHRGFDVGLCQKAPGSLSQCNLSCGRANRGPERY